MSSGLGMLAKFSLWAFMILMASSIGLAILASSMNYVSTPYSLISTAKNGLSELRKILRDNGFETSVIISDPEAAMNLNEPLVYVIIGPTLDYDMQSLITLLYLLQNGSSLMIVDDFGRANSIIDAFFSLLNPNEMFQFIFGHKPADANVTKLRLYINTSVVVLDASSYWKNPANIIVEDFDRSLGIFSPNVQRILARFASTFFIDVELSYINGSKKRYNVPIPSELGIMRTTQYSWLETDLKSIIEGTARPDYTEFGGVPFTIGLTFTIGGSRIMIISDPDIFTNEAFEISQKSGFDNRAFALDVFRWLSDGKRRIVLFDESRKGITPENPLFGIAVSVKAISFISRYWIIAPLIPLIFTLFFAAYIPRQFKEEVKIFKVTRKREGIPPYYGRYLWYMYKGGLEEAFKIIVGDLKQAIKLKTGTTETEWDRILEHLKRVRPDLSNLTDQLGEITKIWDLMMKGKRVKLRITDYTKMFELIKQIRSKL
ncbi:MAG: DUF4350 domain-containing protein [Crenarchaeota archaeon]|nr:DUF4350 domain-containing protein [Thermoproteota archaeon]